MAIERLVYECSKNGIEKDTSGGQIYSYTKGMKEYLEDPEIGIERLESYEQPVDFEADPEKNLAPMSFTYNQMETLFPKQFRYQVYEKAGGKIFGMSNNCVSLDWDNYKDYHTYLQMRGDGNNIVSGRSGAHEFCVFAGDYKEIIEYPICYYLSESLKNPYTPEDFCRGIKPGYMQPLSGLQLGDEITIDSVREFISEERDRSDLLKKMAYAFLHYKADASRNYDRNIVICDEKENICYWIGAITMLFSKKIAKEISFSTYEYSPIGSEFRICGAFPVGTEYDFNEKNSASYVFDCWNMIFEDVDFQGNKGFYDFLVSSFMYQIKNLEDFYGFVDKFRLDEIGTNLEGYYHAYEMIKGNEQKQLSSKELELLVCVAKTCFDNKLLERIFIIIINYYVEPNHEIAENYEDMLRNVMVEKKKIIEPLQNRCAYGLVTILKPDSGINITEIQTVYQRYQKLFGYAGLDFANAFYSNMISQANMVMINNRNYSYNVYFGVMIVNHVVSTGRNYERFKLPSEEGNWLRCVVANLLSAHLEQKQLMSGIQTISESVKDDAKGTISLLIAMEDAAREFGADSTEWLRASERFLKEYEENDAGSYISIYEELVALRRERRVVQNILVRMNDVSDFENLLNDVTWLFKRYGYNFQAYREQILVKLVEYAEKTANTEANLQKILALCDMEKEEEYGVIIQRMVAAVDLSRNMIDLELLQKMERFYQRKQLPLDDKLKICKLLQGLQTDCKQGKRTIITKYGKGVLSGREKYRMPNMSEAERISFLQRYVDYVIEIYTVCEDLKVIGYFNHLLELDMTSQKDMISLEISSMILKERGAVELIANLIGLSVSLNLLMEEEKLAELLLREHVNISKLNKYMQERDSEIFERIKIGYPKEIDLRNDKRNLKNYWERVYGIAAENDDSIVKKFMKGIFRR